MFANHMLAVTRLLEPLARQFTLTRLMALQVGLGRLTARKIVSAKQFLQRSRVMKSFFNRAIITIMSQLTIQMIWLFAPLMVLVWYSMEQKASLLTYQQCGLMPTAMASRKLICRLQAGNYSTTMTSRFRPVGQTPSSLMKRYSIAPIGQREP